MLSGENILSKTGLLPCRLSFIDLNKFDPLITKYIPNWLNYFGETSTMEQIYRIHSIALAMVPGRTLAGQTDPLAHTVQELSSRKERSGTCGQSPFVFFCFRQNIFEFPMLAG